MRRLSLLLLLIVLLCAFPALAAEKPFTLTDGCLIPDSATTASADRFGFSYASHFAKGLAFPLIGLSVVTPPYSYSEPAPSSRLATSYATAGVAKARVQLPVYSTGTGDWYARFALVPPRTERRAWALTGLRLKVESTRTVKRLVCRGRLRGSLRTNGAELPFPKPSAWARPGALVKAHFAILPRPHFDNGPPSDIWSWATLWDELLTWADPAHSLMDGGITYSGHAIERKIELPLLGLPADSRELAYRAFTNEAEQRSVAGSYLEERRQSSVPEPMLLYPGSSEYWVVLLLEVAYFPRVWSVVSDTDLDFYSGDYGAYFDSLELELEPLKQST